MPVTVVPSSRQSAKKSSTSRKRRQNQNEEIHELASLVPLSSSQLSGLIPSNGGKPQTISVLRLTTTFLKLQSFIKDASSWNDKSGEHVSLGRMEEAIDGFLIVLDKDANILYVSETIAGHVGLIQQDVIGQNLADITHPEFSANIADSLKPSLILPTSLVDEFIVSQHKQFFMRLKPNVSYSASPSHCLVHVCGNLKVQLSPSKTTSSGQLEFIEPSVIGFIGECRVVESVASILEISIPHSTFTVTRTLDMKKVISVEAIVKEILGYDPKVFCDDSVVITDFIHPADQLMMMRKPSVEFMMKKGHGVSPLFRFMTGYGEWVWQQVEPKLRYKDGTSIPHFWEIRIRVLGKYGGSLNYIEQRELYQSTKDQGSRNGCSDTFASTCKYQAEPEAKPVVKCTRKPEPVLHDHSVAMDDFFELMRQMLIESMTSKNAPPRDDHAQCQSVANMLSPASTTAESSPISSSGSQGHSSVVSPIAPSAMQIDVPVSGSGTQQRISIPQIACTSDLSTRNCLSPQPHVLQKFTETCPPCNSAISTDFSPSNTYPILHSASSTDSIPSANSVPFQNPNFTPQAPLNNFNFEIPSNFNFSTCNTTTQPFNAQSPPFFDSAVSMPTTQTFDSLSMLISSDESLVQQLVGGVSMDESSLDTLAASPPDPAASMDPMLSYSPPQTNFVSNSNSSASLQDSMLCSPTHLNADFTMSSQVLVHSQSFNLHGLSSNPEVQDILQQFM